MTFFRHFIERKDFCTLVITNSRHVKDYELSYEPIDCGTPAWLNRISRTRFLPWVYGFQCLYGGRLLSPEIIHRAKQFKPDAAFTMAGSWDWTALAAKRVAKRLKIPLIASFNDWFDYGWFPADKSFHGSIEERFRRYYREADLALCTSEGMLESLGAHANAHLLYPTGSVMPTDKDVYQPVSISSDRPFTVFFGGSLGDWYGPMLESLIICCQKRYPGIRFQVFGGAAKWSSSFDSWAKQSNIFAGQVSFERLCQEAKSADLLLLPMGFDESCAQVERTSFKTKFLDYLSFRRPILVWGPDYCSAVRTAQEFDSAEYVTNISPTACADAIYRLALDPVRRKNLIINAQKMYSDRFHPDAIHAGLVDKIQETVTAYGIKQKKQRNFL
jgi:glycosyltransferase involved in cell wall biosynthesis